METQIVNVTEFEESETFKHKIGKSVFAEYEQTLQTYRADWGRYNRAKKQGEALKSPSFPYPPVRVCRHGEYYRTIDKEGTAIVLAARVVKINRIPVAVESRPEKKVDPSKPVKSIHPNLFFGDFKTALRTLEATQGQRVEFFKPIVRAVFNEGFTDRDSRLIFLNWLKNEIDRYIK